MRKYAGILAATLVAVPAVVSAYTLAVQVSGGKANTNYVEALDANGATLRTFTGGTNFIYPSGTTTIKIHLASGYTAQITDSNFSGGAVIDGTSYLVNGADSAQVVFTAPSLIGFNITQASGGTIRAALPNNTTTTGNPTGLQPGSSLNLLISAMGGYQIDSYTIGSTTKSVANGDFAAGTANLTVPYAVVDGQTVTAAFSQTQQNVQALLQANLMAPLAGYTGQVVKGTAVSTSPSATYVFTLIAPDATDVSASITQTGAAYQFTPTQTGNYTLSVTANGFAVPAKTIAIASYTAFTTSQCASCHSTSTPEVVADFNTTGHMNSNRLDSSVKSCQTCHTSSPHTGGATCVGCHSVAQDAGTGFVQDNNGVRAITTEFQKWSHHIVNKPGVALQSEQCAVCHLEGTVDADGLGVDATKHMADTTIHLRNADDDSDMQWDPANPNHTTMDTFCMSCHDANGATSPMNAKLQALISPKTGITASPKNPFGDTISNRYDKMMRPAVTDVSDQFNTSNNSHHAVKGPRYSGRTRVAGPRSIDSVAFAANSSATLQGIRSTIYDAGNFNSLYTPLENTGGEATPRTGAASLGDDSTLHCGDCHTVGQWKAGSSVNAAGQPTSAAIGAHGSNNEYMLRNSLGTDERHTQRAYTVDSVTKVVTYTNPNAALLVCFNCHNVDNYGQYMATGLNGANAAGAQVVGRTQSHAGEYAEDGRCNGNGNTISFAGYTTGAATDGTQFESRLNGLGAKATGEHAPEFGNIFGIQCLNCHNSGVGNAYGGIHGSANNTSWNGVNPDASVKGGAYIDGMGNTQKVERFLPGLNDVAHVPGVLGGFTGGTTAMSVGVPAGKYNAAVPPYAYTTGGISKDTNWEQKGWQQTATTVINYKTGALTGTAYAGAGCYTLGDAVDINKAPVTNVAEGLKGPSVTGQGGAATELMGTWGGCEDHAGAQGTANHGFVKRIVRPITY